jgi:nucleotidyltransferase/DNA polymerase involved in DNA repair
LQISRLAPILNICMVDVNRAPRIAAVHLHQLPFECAFGAQIEREGLAPPPAAVRADVRGRSVLIDLSPEARRRGLLPGMTVTEAKARVPELDVRDRDVELEKSRLESAAEILLAYGSLVEVTPPAFAFVEIGRSSCVLEKLLAGKTSTTDPKSRPGYGTDRSRGARAEPSDAIRKDALGGGRRVPARTGTELSDRRTSSLEVRIAEHIVRALERAGHRVSVAIAKDPDMARTLAAQRSVELRIELARSAPSSDSGRVRIRGKRAARDVKARIQPNKARASKRDPRPKSEHGRDRGDRSGVVVPPGREIASLSRLPVEALLWTDALEDPEGIQRERMHAIHASLRVLGIHDVARLRTLPPNQVATRFGEAGAILMARAMGKRERPLRPFALPIRIIESQDLDGPIEDLEPVLFMLKRIFDRLEVRLEARGSAAGALSLVFEIEPTIENAIRDEDERAESSKMSVEVRLSFARPTRRAQTMLALAKEKLQNALPGAVLSIAVEVLAASADRGAQLDLFSAYTKKVEAVSELIGRLQASLGENAVFSPEVSDTHRPEVAWRMRPFEIERALDALKYDVSPSQKRDAPIAKRAPHRGTVHPTQALPEVREDLLVAEMPKNDVVSIEATLAELNAKKRAWPKPIQRKIEDEPLPKLGARPLELFSKPEPATLIAAFADSEGKRTRDHAGVLVWRGERTTILSLSGCERFETEWWSDEPLAREYVIAELSDGRKLWLYFEPSGELYVHGAFD